MNNKIMYYLLAAFLLLSLTSGRLQYLVQGLTENPIAVLIPLGLQIIGIIIGISLHEFAHAFAAYRLGDPTAKIAGRLTIDPRSHLDPLGTIALFIVGFGWGKPTPFDPYNLRNVKRDSAIISAAGAVMNFIVAIVLSLPYMILFYSGNLSETIIRIYTYLSPIIYLNVLLGVFNLLPVSPLDGFKVLAGFLPREWYHDFMETEKYGIFILLLLLATGIIGRILLPITSTIIGFLIPSLNIPF